MPRHCIAYPGICFTTEEKSRKNHQSGFANGARLPCVERDSSSRLGHRRAIASTGLLDPAVRLSRHVTGSTFGLLGICRVSELGGFPMSAKFESKFAVTAPMW